MRPTRRLAQLAADRVADRDGERPEQRRERADAPFVAAEGLRPAPGEDVVERRVRLARLHLVEHVAEAAGDHPHHRDHLVVVEALDAERAKRIAAPAAVRPASGRERPAVRGRLRGSVGSTAGGPGPRRGGGGTHGRHLRPPAKPAVKGSSRRADALRGGRPGP